MSKINLDAYIFFKDGKCVEAMEFYKGVFGGELFLQKYDEVPGMGDMPNAKGRIMHASLKGGLVGFMASDSTIDEPFGRSAITISLSGDHETEADLKEVFEKLSDGGKIDQPLEAAPWGATFGGVTDKYGVEWMVNIDDKKE